MKDNADNQKHSMELRMHILSNNSTIIRV